MRAVCYLASLQYVIHRDVASSNFLVTRRSQPVVKLADFGRARYVYDDDYEADQSEMMTVKWSSPEVLASSHYSTKSDVWAAGVVMWEIMTLGQRPYSSLSAEQTAVYVLNGGRLSQPSECPRGLYSAMAACWRHRPSDRPTAAQLADIIRDDEPLTSHDSLRQTLQLTS